MESQFATLSDIRVNSSNVNRSTVFSPLNFKRNIVGEFPGGLLKALVEGGHKERSEKILQEFGECFVFASLRGYLNLCAPGSRPFFGAKLGRSELDITQNPSNRSWNDLRKTR